MNVAPKLNSDLYERDFVEWTETQAQLLHARRFAELDLANLTDEVESLGRSDRRSLESQMVRLLAHLLKWRFQPTRRSASWRNSILGSRREILFLLRDSPSLRSYAQSVFAEDYDLAVREAAAQTRLDRSVFPNSSPFSIEQALDDEFWPD